MAGIRVPKAYHFATPASPGLPLYYSTSPSAFRTSRTGLTGVGIEYAKSGPFTRRPASPYLKFTLHRSPLEKLVSRWRSGDVKSLVVEMGSPASSLLLEDAEATRQARSAESWASILAFRELVEAEFQVGRELSTWRNFQLSKEEGQFAVLVYDAAAALRFELADFFASWEVLDERLAKADAPVLGTTSVLGGLQSRLTSFLGFGSKVTSAAISSSSCPTLSPFAAPKVNKDFAAAVFSSDARAASSLRAFGTQRRL